MPTDRASDPVSLDGLRGRLPRARANARTVAALTDNPGCARRRVLDAAGVETFALARALGHDPGFGQSPIAIASGNAFERRLKRGSDYALLAEALRPFVQLPDPPNLRVRDLERVSGFRPGHERLVERARRTVEVLGAIARDDEDAPHVVDHPVLTFDLAGAPVFLEPDALAFRVGRELQLVEIKSYPIIDGQADPKKLAATAGQAAVYLLALRWTLERQGLDASVVRDSVVLVAPKNFGRYPVAHEVPLARKLVALERVMGAVPRADALLGALPSGFTLDVDGTGALPDPDASPALTEAVQALEMQYVPECLASCDLARFCRAQATRADEPSRLGRGARDDLAGVDTLADALRLATRGPGPGEAHLADVAAGLHDAYAAIARARDDMPPSGGRGTRAESRGMREGRVVRRAAKGRARR